MAEINEIPQNVIARLGESRSRDRLRIERHLSAVKQGAGPYFWRRYTAPRPVVRAGLAVLGWTGRAHEEFLNVRIVENLVTHPDLPAAFDGFRLAQIADLHCDLEPLLIDRVIELMDGLAFDLCVHTGDYHDEIGKPWNRSLDLMRKLIPHCGAQPIGILGNHDFLAKVAPLEAAGLRILLNENVSLERDGQRLWMCGIDDPHSFRTNDLARAGEGVPPGEFRILLSHSPEAAWAAAELGYPLMLTGHTHGGQICLPGGFPVVRRAAVPRPMLSGRWRVGGLQGYTSPGTGGCSVAARLNCPPEITVHVLRRG